MKGLIILAIPLLAVDVVSYCTEAPEVPNAHPDTSSSGPFYDGFEVKFVCNHGYSESGTNPTYVCSGSSWAGGDIKCSVILCSHIAPPKYGKITNSPDFAAGSSVTFSCNPGYDMNGAGILTCGTDRHWRPIAPPTCNAKICPDFGNIPNATTSQEVLDGVSNGFGSVVRVRCDEGYVLDGKVGIKCLETEQWQQKPICKPVSCPRLPGADSKCIDKIVFYAAGNMAVIICKDDSASVSVTRNGARQMDTVCKNNEWTVPETACYCDCLVDTSTPHVSVYNLTVHGFLKHEDTLNWNCSGGTTKATSEAVVCTDGHLSAEPVCTPPVTPRDDIEMPTTSPSGSNISTLGWIAIVVGIIMISVAIIWLCCCFCCPEKVCCCCSTILREYLNGSKLRKLFRCSNAESTDTEGGENRIGSKLTDWQNHLKLKSDYMQLLKDTPSIRSTSVWETARCDIELDPRFLAVPGDEQREYLFNKYIQKLKKAESMKSPSGTPDTTGKSRYFKKRLSKSKWKINADQNKEAIYTARGWGEGAGGGVPLLPGGSPPRNF